MGEIHMLPPETLNFKWRMRCNIKSAVELPNSNLMSGQSMPSPYVVVGWSLNRLTLENGEHLLTNNETEQTVMADKTNNPNWNQQLLLTNPKNVLDYKAGYFVI